MRGFYLIHVATGVTLIAALVGFYNLKNEPSGRSGVIESVASPGAVSAPTLPLRSGAEPLTFTSHLGEKTSELDFRGRHALVFFGYSSCPDVCPASLVTMKRALELLGEEADSVQPLFISFDPGTDTPEILEKYVAHFDPRLIGLTGTEDEIEAATKAYGVYFEATKGTAGERSAGEIQHSSYTFFIGPGGNARSIFRHNTSPDEMARVMREMLADAAAESSRQSAALP